MVQRMYLNISYSNDTTRLSTTVREQVLCAQRHPLPAALHQSWCVREAGLSGRDADSDGRLGGRKRLATNRGNNQGGNAVAQGSSTWTGAKQMNTEDSMRVASSVRTEMLRLHEAIEQQERSIATLKQRISDLEQERNYWRGQVT